MSAGRKVPLVTLPEGLGLFPIAGVAEPPRVEIGDGAKKQVRCLGLAVVVADQRVVVEWPARRPGYGRPGLMRRKRRMIPNEPKRLPYHFANPVLNPHDMIG